MNLLLGFFSWRDSLAWLHSRDQIQEKILYLLILPLYINEAQSINNKGYVSESWHIQQTTQTHTYTHRVFCQSVIGIKTFKIYKRLLVSEPLLMTRRCPLTCLLEIPTCVFLGWSRWGHINCTSDVTILICYPAHGIWPPGQIHRCKGQNPNTPKGQWQYLMVSCIINLGFFQCVFKMYGAVAESKVIEHM